MTGPEPAEGYLALRERVALLDLTGRGHIMLTGDDRVRLLHAMSTNHIQQLKPGDGCPAFFLSSQGRILASVNVLCAVESIHLDTEPECAAGLAAHLDKYIIADDCTVQDLTPHRCVFAVEGPGAAALLERLGADAPAPGNWVDWQLTMLANVSATGQPGYRIIADRGRANEVEGWLLGAGAIPATESEWRAVRLENARPRFGEDFSEQQIPHETQLLGALHFNKGCYLGQEIVERVRSRGHVNRKLVQLLLDGVEPPAPGTPLTLEGKDVGTLMSAAWSPALGKSVGLGYLRAEVVERKVAVRAGAMLARATDRVPA